MSAFGPGAALPPVGAAGPEYCPLPGSLLLAVVIIVKVSGLGCLSRRNIRSLVGDQRADKPAAGPARQQGPACCDAVLERAARTSACAGSWLRLHPRVIRPSCWPRGGVSERGRATPLVRGGAGHGARAICRSLTR